MHRNPRLKGIVGVILHMLGSLHLLEKGGGIPQLDRQIMKVPKFEGVNRSTRLYFQAEEKIFLCTPLEVEEPTSFQEVVNSSNHKEWMNGKKQGSGTCSSSSPT